MDEPGQNSPVYAVSQSSCGRIHRDLEMMSILRGLDQGVSSGYLPPFYAVHATPPTHKPELNNCASLDYSPDKRLSRAATAAIEMVQRRCFTTMPAQ